MQDHSSGIEWRICINKLNELREYIKRAFLLAKNKKVLKNMTETCYFLKIV